MAAGKLEIIQTLQQVTKIISAGAGATLLPDWPLDLQTSLREDYAKFYNQGEGALRIYGIDSMLTDPPFPYDLWVAMMG